MKKPSFHLFRSRLRHLLAASLLSGAVARSATVDLTATSAAAAKSDPEAEFALGKAYFKGMGEPKDNAQALKYFRMAADQGNMKAENNLGSMYEAGEGTNRDPVEAAKWYRQAAEQGAALAQYNLALLLLNGEGMAVDAPQAVQWLEKAANQGVIEAAVELGRLYTYGAAGVPPNGLQAAKWLEPAAAKGNAQAETLLAYLYSGGHGFPHDLHKAVTLYESAAQQGDAEAQRNLGTLYCMGGLGIRWDPVNGYKWLLISAHQGDFRARHLLDEFRKRVTEAQVEEAKKLADSFKPTAPVVATR